MNNQRFRPPTLVVAFIMCLAGAPTAAFANETTSPTPDQGNVVTLDHSATAEVNSVPSFAQTNLVIMMTAPTSEGSQLFMQDTAANPEVGSTANNLTEDNANQPAEENTANHILMHPATPMPNFAP